MMRIWMESMERFLLWRKRMVRPTNQRVQGFYPKDLYKFVCEDEKSMRYYLDAFGKTCKKICITTIHSNKGTNVSAVVNRGLLEHQEMIDNADKYGENSKVIICFDKDDNDITTIKAKMQEIKKLRQKYNSIASIYNSPCYEYWLLLHTRMTKQRFTSSQCCHETMRAINSHYHQSFEDLDKFKKAEKIFNILGKDLPKAIRNAKSLNFTDDDLDGAYTNAHLIFEEIIKIEDR